MAGGKLTPRQRMINMMYLVLTAMLALNVSAEVLDAFVKIEQGLQRTSDIAQAKNVHTLSNFARAAAENREKVEKWQIKAQLVNEKTNELSKYIQELKLELVTKGDGRKTKAIVDGRIMPEKIEAKDNTDAVNSLLIGPAKNGKAYELRKMIEDYKEFIFANIVSKEDAPGLVDEINGLLNFDFERKDASDGRTWETFTFEGMPLISATAMLTKIQVDIKNSESSLYDYLFSQIDASSFKFTSVAAIVKPITSSAVLKGTDFEAQIFLGAYDPNQKFIAELNSGKYESDAEGKISIKRRGESVGMQSIKGNIKFKGPDGEMTIPINFDYQVVEANLVVSPTKMNVFYLGIENPVSISVAGVPDNNLTVNISNSSFVKKGSEYMVTPKELKECIVTVTSNVNGTTQTMPPQKFRVKRLPPPSPAIHGITGKSATRGELSASQGIVAKMPPDFDFDLKYTVKSFTVGASAGGYWNEEPTTGAVFSDRQRKLMGSLKQGDAVMITNIKALGPDGATVDLNDLFIKVK